MSGWRGICLAIILLIASIGVALGASALQHQTLEIPWTALDPTTQQRLRDVTEHAILFRELHGIVVRSHRPVFEFLIEHPDFAATAGRVLGIIRDRIVKEREGRYWGDDNHGATGTFELVYAAPGQRVYLSEGTFVKRLFPTIYGRIVLVMAYEYQTDQAGESLVVNHIRGYLRIDNPILGVLA
ncbi:MAG: hypothetical protein ACREIN_04030, partial [Candidatus Methylomirabilaceae bacterium]